jgi:hypothetical protein
MSKTHRIITLAFVPVVIFLLYLIVRFESEVRREELDGIGDRLVVALESQLGREEEDALRMALMLSQNEALVEALKNDDEDRGYKLLSEVMDAIKEHTNILLRAQVIGADYTLFARSWDNTYSGMPMEDSRSDLDYFKSHKKPRVSIEVGRRLGIKATVPLFENKKLLGFVEVLQFFDDTTAFFKELGVDLYVLMDEDYYNTAVLMQFNPMIQNYIIANRAFNATHLNMLERLDMKQLRREQVLAQGRYYVFYEPLENAEGVILGAFVMVMPKSQVRHFGNGSETLALLTNFSRQNLYDIVKQKRLEEKIYRSRYDKALLYLKDTVSDEDRELFLQEAQEILESYTKEELIALILEHRSARRIEGEIR